MDTDRAAVSQKRWGWQAVRHAQAGVQWCPTSDQGTDRSVITPPLMSLVARPQRRSIAVTLGLSPVSHRGGFIVTHGNERRSAEPPAVPSNHSGQQKC